LERTAWSNPVFGLEGPVQHVFAKAYLQQLCAPKEMLWETLWKMEKVTPVPALVHGHVAKEAEGANIMFFMQQGKDTLDGNSEVVDIL
jgi:hypothetical protein